jgi:lysozyme
MKTNALGIQIIRSYKQPRHSIEEAERIVRELTTLPLNSNQFSALVSFTMSMGRSALSRSALLKHLNEGDPLKASRTFGIWVKQKGKRKKALVTLRAKEKALFLRPIIVKSE